MSVATQASPRATAILAAALRAFSKAGYDAASIAEICRTSASSVGSFYHHFGSKEGVAATLYEEGIRSYQAGLLAALAEPTKPEAAVARLVRQHLTWATENEVLARYLLKMGAVPATVAARKPVRKQNRKLLDAVGSWAQPHIDDGTLLPFEPAQLLAQLLGPSYFVTRAWLAGGVAIDEILIVRFATAAWRAVRVIEEQ